MNDAATQGCVLQILFYLRQIALDSAAKVLVKGGFVAGTEAAKQESNQDKTRDGYNELGVLLLREIPRTQRLDSRHYANTLLSMRLERSLASFRIPRVPRTRETAATETLGGTQRRELEASNQKRKAAM